MLSPLNILLFGLPYKYNLLPSAWKAKKLANLIKNSIEKEYTSRDSDPAYAPRTNILDLMLAHNRSSNSSSTGFHKFSMDDIVADMTLFLLAGTDTTTKTLSGCLYYLAKYPSVADKLYQEMCAHKLQLNSQTEITIDLLNSMVYMEAFLKECLRLLSIAPAAFDKIVLEEFTLGKYRFYRGDKIITPFSYHFNSPKYYSSPEEFQPERFLPPQSEPSDTMAFLPFSSGKRMCLGRNLAETIVKLYLVETLARYTLSLPEAFSDNGWTFGKGGLNQTHCTLAFLPRHSN